MRRARLKEWAYAGFAKRLVWLEDYAASLTASADLPVPDGLREGIRLEKVTFAYPGTERKVLEDVSIDLTAGTVVAIVGENGAGKTTLVKLLSKLYEPSSGAISVDGQPLARMPADAWRRRLSGAFQDFFRFEFRARHSIGVGDVPRLDDRPLSLPRSIAPRLAMSSRASPRVSILSSAQPGPMALKSLSASGRKSASPVDSCGMNRCWSSSMNRPPLSMPKPSTPCSSAMPLPRATTDRTAVSRFSCRTDLAPCEWQISSSSSTVRVLWRPALTRI